MKERWFFWFVLVLFFLMLVFVLTDTDISLSPDIEDDDPGSCVKEQHGDYKKLNGKCYRCAGGLSIPEGITYWWKEIPCDDVFSACLDLCLDRYGNDPADYRALVTCVDNCYTCWIEQKTCDGGYTIIN